MRKTIFEHQFYLKTDDEKENSVFIYIIYVLYMDVHLLKMVKMNQQQKD